MQVKQGGGKLRPYKRVRWTFVVPGLMGVDEEGDRREDASGEKGCSGDPESAIETGT